jgi:hypothetical protein
MENLDRYIKKEIAVSFVANGLVNSLVVWAVFGSRSDVPLWGSGGVAIDFVPQVGAIGLIGSLVPALLTRRRMQNGILSAGLGHSLPRVSTIIFKSFLAAISAILALGFVSTALLALFYPGPFQFWEVFFIKTCVGCIIPFALTPRAIRWVAQP